MSDDWKDVLPVQRKCKGQSLRQYKDFLVDLYTLHWEQGNEINFDSYRGYMPSNDEISRNQKLKIDAILDALESEASRGTRVVDYWFTAEIKQEDDQYTLDSSVVFNWEDREDVKLEVKAQDLEPSALYMSLQNTSLWNHSKS